MNTIPHNTRRAITAVIAAVGAGTLFVGGTAIVAAQIPVPTPAPTVPPVQVHGKRAERHPDINRAIRNLQQAQNNLQHAATDFGGHKEKAMDLIRQAQRELALAKQTDKN